MPYIEQSRPAEGCLFCSKAAEHDDEANHIVYRGPRSFVMLNLFPYNSGHLMVIPYQHAGHLGEIEADTGAELFRLVQLSVQVLDEALHPAGYNVGVNQGTVAGAGIADHIHVHVVPRWNGDTNFMPALADVKVIPEALSATAAKLRPVYERLAPGE